MRVLIACEFSGVVRDAFEARGHYVVSCDLLPAEDAPADYPDGSHRHVQGDVLRVMDSPDPFWKEGERAPWDLMIAFPPCTHLASSGARWWPSKALEQAAAVEFVKTLMAAPIARIAIENPIGKLSTAIRKPDQIIQPWLFGHGETKATCFWLKGLPKLIPTNVVEGREARVHRASPGPDRWKDRSRTLPGIAEAMADQWGFFDVAA